MVSLNKQQGLSTRERREAMRFKPNLQSSLAVLIALLVLLTACSPLSGNPVTASTPTVRPTHQVTPTHTVNSVTDSCPASAKPPEMRGKGGAGDLPCRGARGPFTLSGGQCEG